jgi:hypothetical protein
VFTGWLRFLPVAGPTSGMCRCHCVPRAGLEPARIAATVFETVPSTGSGIGVCSCVSASLSRFRSYGLGCQDSNLSYESQNLGCCQLHYIPLLPHSVGLCLRRESNSHALRRQLLRLVCLPFHHEGAVLLTELCFRAPSEFRDHNLLFTRQALCR